MIAQEVKRPAKLEDIKAHAKRSFTTHDKALLKRYELVAETIAAMFGEACEVVIHSLEDLGESIVKIVHGQVTGRGMGSPITDLGLHVLNSAYKSKEDIVGPYFSKSTAGKPLKSTTMVIRNDEGLPIGFLCVNFDLSVSLHQILREFSPSMETPHSGETFAPDVTNLVAQAVADEIEVSSHITGVSATSKNRNIVATLEDKGMFEIKGSVELVASELGLTKHTIYKYLREMRQE
jgi:predicted transcriptional regulator YheO